MKNQILVLLLATSPLFIQAQNATQNDKEFLFNYYQETLNQLDENISGLTETQLHFKPSENSWSISQCVEHIILTENMIFEMLKGYMAQPANPERRNEIVYSDEQIIKMVTDRSEKYKAPEVLQAEGKYDDAETAFKDLENQRKEILEFIKNADLEDLRNHVSDSPAGPTDAYQSLLFLAGHTARHTLQIEEVKADTHFPKN